MRSAVIAFTAMVCVGRAWAGSDSAASDSQGSNDSSLDEVVVTAQKVEQRLLDVPVPVSVVDAQELVNTGKLQLIDYYDTVPGLIFQPSQLGGYTVNIRGLSQFSGGTTVAILVDGVPIGGGGGVANPDLDPSTLERIEVLRGPQGTLWGASTIGGVINFVTKTPSTDSLSGRVQADVSGVANGDGPNYGGRAAVNLPLSSTFAIQASGSVRRDAGFIDNVQTNPPERGANWGNVTDGRFGALWQPRDNVSLRLNAIIQDGSEHGIQVVQTNLPDLQQSVLKGTGLTGTHVEDYSAVFNIKMSPSWELTSLTGYNTSRTKNTADQTLAYQPIYAPIYGNSAEYSQWIGVKADQITEELHLTAHLGQAIDWLMGGYYNHESTDTPEYLYVNNPTTGAVTSKLFYFNTPGTIFRESAAFTNITVHLSEHFDLQVGGRESFIYQWSQSIYEIPGIPNIVFPVAKSNENVFTYLFVPTFKISPESMVYARVASGYRPGGSNVSPGVPQDFGPDKTYNYELGVKGDVFERKLTLDTSIYYIDWKGIQIGLLQNGVGYTGNGGRAKSEGVEFSLRAHPFRGSTIGGWIAWNEAHITEGFEHLVDYYGNPLTPADGSGQLPPGPRWSGNVSIKQEFPLGPSLSAFVGAMETYVGDRLVYLGPAYPGYLQVLPSYAKTDLNAGVMLGPWSVLVFANNVTDRRGALNLADNTIANGYAIITPRTVGLSVVRTF